MRVGVQKACLQQLRPTRTQKLNRSMQGLQVTGMAVQTDFHSPLCSNKVRCVVPQKDITALAWKVVGDCLVFQHETMACWQAAT